ncbi:response regulator [Anaerovorax odorimutans]|uniref:Stage 0 sporulation protein A homolog n=1 Tax=Anaerovorax odorimutans TaxID=109327 RepID=A0ABT1RP51_9FIRM|nr:response regulator [Anaerovorax odorimutans]MCQ4636939.1 response regulator [Anaerovorax odorimutans]
MKKIMIVDDAMFMRKVIRTNLEKGGYTQILEAENGEQALELFKEEKPDLVLLDITMPGKSGIQVLKEIVSMEPEAKVIMCSAVGQEMMITQAIEAGASDFIVKPFNGDEFMKVVENWMPERA